MPLSSFDLQHAPCGIFTFDGDHLLQAVNQTLADMLGLAPADLVGQPLDRLFTPANRLLFHMQVMSLLHMHGQVEEISLSLASARGVAIPVLFNAVRRERGSGAVTECIVIRVRERKRLEDELFNIRKATEQVPGMIYQYLLRADGTSCYPYASEGIRVIYGLRPLQLLHSADRVFELIHPDDLAAVRAAIATSAKTLCLWHQEYRVNLKHRGVRWLLGHAKPESRSDGSVLWHGYVSDVTERKTLETALAGERQEVEHRASHDHLTGLPNRAEFERRFNDMFASALATGAEHALCCIDLDRFKAVNDGCGHAAGDLLLRQVSALLLTCVRAKDTVARLGGDEFALLLENCSLDAAQHIAQDVCERVAELHFQNQGKRFSIGASIGVVCLDSRWGSAQAAQQAADGACFVAKESGRGRAHVYQQCDYTGF